MSERRLTLAELLEVLGGDESFLDEAREAGLHHDEPTYDVVYCERVRVARTLVRDLDVNWPGVEVVLRLREELVMSRRHVRRLATELARKDRE
ncbi:MAG: hypothetical protein CMN30_07530 [Sandaracinus sp.]|mgnify:CR=1 FL=1|nr:hypothetical protein [Sandaracinus sp.]|tara:strand:+ start:237 stop:515 length:279 start_codon:yes stop_codon:yes gene_type:complete